jgi:hypothetical protein
MMSEIRQMPPVKLFIGILSSIPEILPEVDKFLMAELGPIDLRSQAYSFDQTHYYDAEMGCPIQRWFIGFANLISAQQLACIKLRTNELEAHIRASFTRVPRPVNLDPGYIEQAKIILASTKNFYHRIPISEGIYAEVTMHFETGSWRAFPWTFPDFKSGQYVDFFSELRKIYRSQLKNRSRPPAAGPANNY